MAQRHPTSSRRADKPSSSNEAEDAFVARVFELSTWARENTQTLAVLLIVVVAIGAGVRYWVSYQADVAEQAVVELEQIQQATRLGDPEAAKTQLQQYIERFGGTPYAEEARLVLAELHLESGFPHLALDALEGSSASLREPIGIQIAILAAKAHESAGQLDRAEAGYLEVADRAELGFQVVNALGDAARVREMNGDLAGAVELYEDILVRLEDAPAEQRGPYEMRLAEVRAGMRG